MNMRSGARQWARFTVPWRPDKPQNAFVVIKENPDVSVLLSAKTVNGVLTYVREKQLNVGRGVEGLDPNQPVVMWNMRSVLRKTVCFRAATAAYSPDKVTDGFLRPYEGPHMWVSQPMQPGNPEWLQLSWDEPVAIQEVQLIFNDDVNEDLINLHHHRTPFEIIPQLVKNFSIQIQQGDGWNEVFRCAGNRRRMIKCAVDRCETRALRIVVESTNGGGRAEIAEVRCFG
jgi:hypothetical protein